MSESNQPAKKVFADFAKRLLSVPKQEVKDLERKRAKSKAPRKRK
jgi:hypothetical protein